MDTCKRLGLGWRRQALFGLALLALVAMPLALAPLAHADDDDDHDLARDLHEGGEIRALSEILREVGRSVPGEIVAVNLVSHDGSWVYRIQVVTPDGRRSVVDVDAGKGSALHDAGRD